jgi:prepilin-type N-terminal cleavage/methylation domain-containing protein
MLAKINVQKGFTLIELVVVIRLLGILSAVAFPKFINLSVDAKIQVLTRIKTSVKAANDLLKVKSYMPSYSSIPVPGRADLIDIDMDGDGTFDTIGNDKVDVRLKWRYLDNTDLEKRIDISNEFVFQEEGIDFTYIGYDSNGNNQSKDDNCYFKYTQAQSATEPPKYEISSLGC